MLRATRSPQISICISGSVGTTLLLGPSLEPLAKGLITVGGVPHSYFGCWQHSSSNLLARTRLHSDSLSQVVGPSPSETRQHGVIAGHRQGAGDQDQLHISGRRSQIAVGRPPQPPRTSPHGPTRGKEKFCSSKLSRGNCKALLGLARGQILA